MHQVCDPHRAATYMRIGESRYRWEFRLLEGETAADFESMEALLPLIGPWVEGIPQEASSVLVRVPRSTPSGPSSPTVGATATSSSSATPPT